MTALYDILDSFRSPNFRFILEPPHDNLTNNGNYATVNKIKNGYIEKNIGRLLNDQ